MTKDLKNLPPDTDVYELLALAYSPETGPVIGTTVEFSGLDPETQMVMLETYSEILRVMMRRIEDGVENSNKMLESLIRRH